MSRDLIQERTRQQSADSIVGTLASIRSSAMVVKAKAEELNALRTVMANSVSAQDDQYDQADVDKLDSLKPNLAGLYQAIITYLQAVG